MTSRTAPSYLSQLDGVRAIAVAMVFVEHYPAVSGAHTETHIWSLLQRVRPGFIGVDLFFVLSGFLISRILLSEGRTFGGIDIPSFYTRRFLRIFPAYYAAILVGAFLFRMPWADIVTVATYTTNLGLLPAASRPFEHTWSLAVEEQFYLVWPFFLAAVPLRWGRMLTGIAIPVLAVCSALIIAAIDPGRGGSNLIYSLPVTRMLSLSLGAWLAYRESEGAALTVLRALAIGICGATVLAMALIGRSRGLIPPGAMYWVIVLIGTALLSCGMIAILISRRLPILTPLLRWRPIRYVGSISYGLYLYHYPILYAFGISPAVTEHVGAPASTILTAFLTTVAVAILSYHGLEKPLLRLKTTFVRAKPPLPQAASGLPELSG